MTGNVYGGAGGGPIEERAGSRYMSRERIQDRARIMDELRLRERDQSQDRLRDGPPDDEPPVEQ